MKLYETHPIPLQKIEIIEIEPYFMKESKEEEYIDKTIFEDSKIAKDLYLFISDLFHFSNGYQKNLKKIVFGEKLNE